MLLVQSPVHSGFFVVCSNSEKNVNLLEKDGIPDSLNMNLDPPVRKTSDLSENSTRKSGLM